MISGRGDDDVIKFIGMLENQCDQLTCPSCFALKLEHGFEFRDLELKLTDFIRLVGNFL